MYLLRVPRGISGLTLFDFAKADVFGKRVGLPEVLSLRLDYNTPNPSQSKFTGTIPQESEFLNPFSCCVKPTLQYCAVSSLEASSRLDFISSNLMLQSISSARLILFNTTG